VPLIAGEIAFFFASESWDHRLRSYDTAAIKGCHHQDKIPAWILLGAAR